MNDKRISPLKAIRLKCLDCSCGSTNEVRLCQITDCPLFPYRSGKNPNMRKEATPAQLEALRKGRVAFRSVDNPAQFRKNTITEGNYTPQKVSEENTL